MPTIDVNFNELQRLLNMDFKGDMEKLDDVLSYVKAEVKAYNEKEASVSVEMKDTARSDLWSVEGLARALRGYIGQEKGIKPYTAAAPAIDVYVDADLYPVRPHICCAVVKNVHLCDEVIKGIMHLQDKLDGTQGRYLQPRPHKTPCPVQSRRPKRSGVCAVGFHGKNGA